MPAELESDEPIPTPGLPDDERPDGFPEIDDEPDGPRGQYRRAPPFFRLDLRFEKNWPVGQSGAYLSLVVELLNATFSKEVIEYECRPSGCTGEPIGPVTIPSIGLEAFF
jgi:hypothetical protein